jgi:O-antigen/teichoic acid export membrane protein
VTLRSVLDAVEERAVNANNLYVSVVVTVAGSLALGAALEAEGLALALTVGLTVLGVRTTMAVRQRYPFGWADIMVPQVVAINAVLFVGAVVVQSGRPATTLAPLAVAAVSTLALGVIYLVALRLLGARWIDEIGRRVHVVSSL